MRPLLRTIHHLSCTGGTLISKCLASMEDVALISEVHPFNVGSLRFNPFDPVQQLFSQKLIDNDEEVLKHVFRERVKMAYDFSKLNHKVLVLRDHTHTDYLTERVPEGFSRKSLINTLKFDFDIRPLITVRNPVDTFLSLKKNEWAGGVKDFDEYCERLGLMLDAYKDYPIYKYEDFCSAPDSTLKEMCDYLSIVFDAAYIDKFYTIRLTGDSGRGKEIRQIKSLPRGEYSDEYLEEIHASNNFHKVSERLGYERDVAG
jgi:hypothetical protein